MPTAPTPTRGGATTDANEGASPDLLGGVQVLDVVDVDVAEEDEALDVVGVVLDQLVEEGRRLQGPHVVRQEQRQVEQRRPEVLLQLDGLRGEREGVRTPAGEERRKWQERTRTCLRGSGFRDPGPQHKNKHNQKKKLSSKIIVCIYYQQ